MPRRSYADLHGVTWTELVRYRSRMRLGGDGGETKNAAGAMVESHGTTALSPSDQ